MSFLKFLFCFTPVIASFFFANYCIGQSVYIFKDNSGNVLLTNVVGANKKPVGKDFSHFSEKVKVTWYKDTNVHLYKNWGNSEGAVLPSYSSNRNAYDSIISAAAAQHGLDAGLIKAMMHTESGFNPYARSPVGAQGLMQLMPSTARRFMVVNPWDPQQNIWGAAKYLRFLMNRFNSRLDHVVAAYNAGEGNVDKYGGIPPFRETQDYVQRVLSRYKNLYGGSLSGNYGTNNNYNTYSYSDNTPPMRKMGYTANATFSYQPAAYSIDNRNSEDRTIQPNNTRLITEY